MKKQPTLKTRARELRRHLTPAEKTLWRHLRGRRFAGFKFRRQFATGRYILYFCCPALNLILEIDGETHLGNETRDLERQRWLEAQGCRVLRFWNTEVYDDLETVLEAIWIGCSESTSGP